MADFRPFRALRPTPEAAPRVASPPYDVLSREEARDIADGNPDCFLRVGRADLELPDETDPYSELVYQTGRANLEGLLRRGVMKREAAPVFGVYRQSVGERSQAGFVGLASVADYDAGIVKKHEFTRPAKEADRVRVIEAHASQSGPVFLAYRGVAALDSQLEAAQSQAPDVDFVADDGVRHTVWTIRDSATIEAIRSAFAEVPHLYIADGHHRSAAASRVHEARGTEGSAGILAVTFPAEALTILPYNRVVKGLGGNQLEDFLAAIGESYEVVADADPAAPPEGGFAVYVDGGWYSAEPRPEVIPADAVGKLAVSILADRVLEPILGIKDQRTDETIDFIGGVRGYAELERLVDGGEWAAAFAMSPTKMSELLEVADAGAVMPPKSTWFEPKLRDGLFVHVIDDALIP